MNRYSVLPFSNPSFRENQARLKTGEQPCAICGRAVAQPFKHAAVVVGGGDWARTPDEAKNETDPGYMGEWGIGPDCHRKHLVKELLYCWVAQGFNVLIPKVRGEGFLMVPYGHHNNPALSAIGDLVRCDVIGLDGALEFQCPGRIYYGGEMARNEFAALVVPALEKHYGWTAREIGETEYWELHPVPHRAPT